MKKLLFTRSGHTNPNTMKTSVVVAAVVECLKLLEHATYRKCDHIWLKVRAVEFE